MSFFKQFLSIGVLTIGCMSIQASDESKLTWFSTETYLNQIKRLIVSRAIDTALDTVELKSRADKKTYEVHDTQMGLALFKGSIAISTTYLSGGALPMFWAVGASTYSVISKMTERQEYENLKLKIIKEYEDSKRS